MEFQYSFNLNGKFIPYYHFYYEKEFKEVLRIRQIQESYPKNRYYFKDGTYLPQFISQETTEQFNFDSDYVTFERVMFLIIHRFAADDDIPKDLDNYYYKPFIDVIRRLKIIDDDSWKQAGIMNIAEYGEKESIDMYVVPYQYFIDFLKNELDFLFRKNYLFSSIHEKNIREKMGDEFFDESLLSR